MDELSSLRADPGKERANVRKQANYLAAAAAAKHRKDTNQWRTGPYASATGRVSQRSSRVMRYILVSGALASANSPPSPHAETAHAKEAMNFKLLKTFRPSGLPLGDLVRTFGNILYGTTALGGSAGQGSAFVLLPPTSTTNWTVIDLHDFTGGSDGAVPVGGLAVDAAARTVYGTTSGTSSGSAEYGTIYGITLGSGGFIFKTLHSFQAGEGVGPNAALVLGPSAATGKLPTLYGTTEKGGSAGEGTVFSLTPPAQSGETWTLTTLYSFSGGADGRVPTGKLLLGTDGSLTGTTSQGGNLTCTASANGCGTVFRLTPPKNAGGCVDRNRALRVYGK
jgi:uncharacterized repeat protein (TIGR03803 family)